MCVLLEKSYLRASFEITRTSGMQNIKQRRSIAMILARHAIAQEPRTRRSCHAQPSLTLDIDRDATPIITFSQTLYILIIIIPVREGGRS